jgi:small-conductance mechanosensitive channel
VEIFGIKFIELYEQNGQRLLLTLILIITLFILRSGLTAFSRLIMWGRQNETFRFWTRQGISLLLALLLICGFLLIWFDNAARLTTVLGFISAGLAFALQKVVTSIAGYFVILRGRTFTVGDRIMMSGVRGDVISLSFTQTTIMEMGQPIGERPDEPHVWVKSRQYTGRIVTITNDKIFEEPVYNYSKDFPYLWEELGISVRFKDRQRAEEILLEITKRHTSDIEQAAREAFQRIPELYYDVNASFSPRVYYRLTDNWLELNIRFISKDHGTRDIKDKICRELLAAFDEAGIDLPFPSYEIIGLPQTKE